MLSQIEIKVILENHPWWTYRPESGFSRKGTIPLQHLERWLGFLVKLAHVELTGGRWVRVYSSREYEIEITVWSDRMDPVVYAVSKIESELAFLRICP